MLEFWTSSENNFKINLNTNIQGKLWKNKICSKRIWSETWILFLALNNIHLLRVFGKSLRNNAPPKILSSSPLWCFLQYHQRYSLSYTTYATNASRVTTLPTLTHYPRHPHWHVFQAITSTTQPKLAHHPRLSR